MHNCHSCEYLEKFNERFKYKNWNTPVRGGVERLIM